jgi:Nitrile hydratase beta subunit, C-terminal
MARAHANEIVASAPSRFATGDRVRVVQMYPLGHVRTPWYIRGKSGVIERLCGAYPNPEELAYHRSGLPAQQLYRVRFLQREVWPDYRGSVADTVDLEIYDHWLEPA